MKLSLFRSLCIPTLTYGHDTGACGRNELLPKVAWFYLSDRVGDSVIREGLSE